MSVFRIKRQFFGAGRSGKQPNAGGAAGRTPIDGSAACRNCLGVGSAAFKAALTAKRLRKAAVDCFH